MVSHPFRLQADAQRIDQQLCYLGSVLQVWEDAADVGMLELDFRVAGQCEIVYFGLAAGAIGKGVGRTLMNNAIAIAWSKPIERLWLHTCHFDSPQALDFYKRSGFKAYKFEVEVHPDPRLTGALPRHAAPHVPMVELG